MKKKLRFYLDTSFTNFLFAIEEIEKTQDMGKRSLLLGVISNYEISIFTVTENVLELAKIHIKKSIIPEKKIDNARHLALATINECDALISWNFKHLANIKKEKQVTIVNISEGYNYPLCLITPIVVMGE